MREQSKSAMKIANFLATHPAVLSLVYPGHINYPQADLFKKQMKGNGSVLLFELNTKLVDPMKFVNSLKV
jgi:cystathionine beta-lyase/cystathionine gamma-synthase